MKYMVLQIIDLNLTFLTIVSINGFNFNHAMQNREVPQESVLGPIPFLLYINDLTHVIKCYKVYHFEDDTNLLRFNSSIRKLNRLVNLDMEHLPVWLNANNISLNVQKNELRIFKQKRKILEHEIKLEMNSKRLHRTPSAKYLRVKIDKNLN